MSVEICSIMAYDTGGIAVSQLSSMGAIVNCSFASNMAPMGAGAALNINSNYLFTIYGTNFTSNTASGSQGTQGAALFHSSQSSGALTLLISSSSFSDNFGGALHTAGSYVIINDTSFRDNAGEFQAGAVSCDSCIRLLMQNCELVNSTSLNPGGAVQTTAQVSSGIVMDQVTALNNRCAAALWLRPAVTES